MFTEECVKCTYCKEWLFERRKIGGIDYLHPLILCECHLDRGYFAQGYCSMQKNRKDGEFAYFRGVFELSFIEECCETELTKFYREIIDEWSEMLMRDVKQTVTL